MRLRAGLARRMLHMVSSVANAEGDKGESGREDGGERVTWRLEGGEARAYGGKQDG